MQGEHWLGIFNSMVHMSGSKGKCIRLDSWSTAFWHYLLLASVIMSFTKHSWKLKLLGGVWKPGQVEWYLFTTDRHLCTNTHSCSLNLNGHWGHQCFQIVTFIQGQERQSELIISSVQKVLQKIHFFLPNPFYLWSQGITKWIWLALSRRAGLLCYLQTSVINIWSVTFCFWELLQTGMITRKSLHCNKFC